MNPLGANAWIWVSPLTDERLEALAPRVRAWGFDVLELPIEQLDDWDPARAAEILQAHELRATVCVAMGPGRELCATDAATVASTQAFLKACIDKAAVVGAGAIAGPIYASVGRTWRMTAGERKAVYAELREALRPVAEYGAERAVKLAIEPLIRYETSVINTTEQALEAIDGLPPEGCGLLSTPTTRTSRRRTSPPRSRWPATAWRTCTPRPTTAARPAPTTSTGPPSATPCAPRATTARS